MQEHKPNQIFGIFLTKRSWCLPVAARIPNVRLLVTASSRIMFSLIISSITMPIHVTTVSLALFSIGSISDASSSVSKPYATKLCGFCGKRVQTLAYVCACTTFKYRYNLNSLRRVFKFSGFITLEPMQTPTSCIRACTWWQFKRNPRQRSTMKEINPSSKNAGKKRKHKSALRTESSTRSTSWLA